MSGPWFMHRSGQVTRCTIAHDDRPVVVIDPEDAEQVERLRSALLGAVDIDCTDVAAALREFANPTPRIEEPQGLGAVVEARITFDGDPTERPLKKWALAEDGSWSCLTDGCTDDRSFWAFFTDVRVLSEGVTP